MKGSAYFLKALVWAVIGIGFGFGLVYGAYFAGILSWSAVTEKAPILILGLGLITSAGASIVLAVPESLRIKGLATFVGFGLGISGGSFAPGALGETPVWEVGPESVVYGLDVQEWPIDSELIQGTNNPLEGERSTLNYLAPLVNSEFLMVSSAGTEIFEVVEDPEFDTTALAATLSLWTSDGELSETFELSALEPSLQLIRGIYFDQRSSSLYMSNLPLGSDCFGLQLWKLEVGFAPLELAEPKLLYTSEPCLDSMTGAERFGGRIVVDGDGDAYLTVGDFGNGVSTVREEQQDGIYSDRPEIMLAPNSVGAVVKIAGDGLVEVISRGHRNPQGLHLDEETGNLWESEHGPKGGDEVNLITPGSDYGWPDVTYGGPYGGPPQPSNQWNLGRWYGADHGSFTEPTFTWLPSIAASQLLVYRGSLFEAWNGDLLVTSFKGKIHRLRLDDQRVVFDEVIDIGVRPRDLVELSDGSLLISTDSSTLMRIQPAG